MAGSVRHHYLPTYGGNIYASRNRRKLHSTSRYSLHTLPVINGTVSNIIQKILPEVIFCPQPEFVRYRERCGFPPSYKCACVLNSRCVCMRGTCRPACGPCYTCQIVGRYARVSNKLILNQHNAEIGYRCTRRVSCLRSSIRTTGEIRNRITAYRQIAYDLTSDGYGSLIRERRRIR